MLGERLSLVSSGIAVRCRRLRRWFGRGVFWRRVGVRLLLTRVGALLLGRRARIGIVRRLAVLGERLGLASRDSAAVGSGCS